MRTGQLLVTACFVVLAAAACGTAGSATAGAGSPVPVPAGQLNTGTMNAPPLGVEAAGNDVMFNAEQSGCQVITAQTTTQTATQVTIQVITTNTSKGNQMCPMIVRVVPVVAQLSAPLGSRTIVFQAVTRHS
jgi:hypothetical protein